LKLDIAEPVDALVEKAKIWLLQQASKPQSHS